MNLNTDLIIIDNINIKTLVETISLHLKNNNIKKYSNLRLLYSAMLSEIGEDIKDSYLNRILKYMSSDKSSIINLIEDFNDGVYETELKKFISKLVSTINQTENNKDLYYKLNDYVDFPFYNEKDFIAIKDVYYNQKYELFVFKLFKHAFMNYKINLPGIVGKRIYHEALTSNQSHYNRNVMMKASADLGCEQAARLYGDYIYISNPDEAIIYYLKDKNNPSSLWNIAFSIENNKLSKKTIKIVQDEFKDILCNNKFTQDLKIIDSKFTKELLDSIKIYLYIIDKYGFSKAYNSMGKLTIFEAVEYKNSREETIKIAKKYLKKAINMGNIHSMTNYAIYLLNHKEDYDYNETSIYKYLKTAANLADPLASYYFGLLLVEQGHYEDALKKFELASSRGQVLADYEIAKIFEKQSKYNEAIDLYNKAVLERHTPAIYDLGMLYYKLYMTKEKIYEGCALLCRKLFDEYYNLFNDEMQNNIKKIINSLN